MDRQIVLAVVLAVCVGASVTIGAAMLLPAAGWIAAGVIGGLLWAWLVFGDVA